MIWRSVGPLALSVIGTGCAPQFSVVYPVCTYGEITAPSRGTFNSAVEEVVEEVFHSTSTLEISATGRTVIVTGTEAEHERFADWWVMEACLPNYRSSNERGVFVVCTAFLEYATKQAIAHGKSVGPIVPPLSTIYRNMDARFLSCHR